MSESNNRGDLQVNVVRQSSLRPSGTLKSTLSGRSTPRGSPSFRRLHSSRTPRREARTNLSHFQWIRGNRLVFWLILITLWAYLGFFFQSKWAHNDNKEGFVGYQSKSGFGISDADQDQHSNTDKSVNVSLASNASSEIKSTANLKKFVEVSLAKKPNRVSSRRRKSKRSTIERSRAKQKPVVQQQSSDLEEEIPRRNTSYGLIVGPFGKTEDSILGWSAEKRSGTCDRKGEFSRIVWSRSFVLILHELSMTGSPLSMMELATELLSCGATVSVVVLSKKGGLMGELSRRGIKVLKDKAELSYKTAMKADLVIAGSAVCASWIEQYLSHFTAGSSQIVWWIMENRREYFDRSKHMLNRVKMLVFLSDSQSKQWLAWCEEEHVQLSSQPMMVPLSVNDELAFVAGIPCSLNTPSFSVEKMLEKRRLLRNAVREEMGLAANHMLVISLSSINPGKGQLLLLESALLTVEQIISLENNTSNGLIEKKIMSGITVGQGHSTMDGRKHSRSLFQRVKRHGRSADRFHRTNGSDVTPDELKRKKLKLADVLHSSKYRNNVTHSDDNKIRKMLPNNEERPEQTLTVLIGSIGSKSNKVLYIKGILRFLSQHSALSKLVLWTPATTRVASLYAAADVYVINAQGLGETFGRVTIEAMAFGLPVLGTDAGGTKEIVEHNVTGLLHPVGRQGIQVLSQNLQFLLKNPSEREKMGMRGRSKIEDKFLKIHMYKRFAKVLIKCMKIK
ncbi:uncharacterized protein LOC143846995 [Tasmannia lanceolata]|uniref:uncharacterized protein LOC143846995 n=1 Tax=Tasmannia lanceolata TaxID=3420 RepID=UPI0040628219